MKKEKSNEVKIEVSLRFKLPGTPYKPLRKTRQERKNKIGQLTCHLGGFYAIPLIMSMQGLQQCINGLEGIQRSYRKRLDELGVILKQNEVITPSIWMCVSEFMAFLSELQTADYGGSARTLRWILETTLKACEFQTNPLRPTAGLLISKYTSMIRAKAKRKQVQFFMHQHNAWISFLERLRVYEETKRIAPSFRELVNKLRGREIFKHAPKLADELKRIYEALSNYVHPSVSKIADQLEEKKPPIPRFDIEEFEGIYSLAVKTLDIIEFVYVEALSHYHGFKDSRKFLEYTSTMIVLPLDVAAVFLKLPFTRELSRGITWKVISPKPRIAKKSRKKRVHSSK